ncbi:MAG: phospho-N-acetylmuramoyl-pentapeptide-transferase [Planctomycetota bacterium]|nr:phospho-N-acetylmuramoyl-pentapeptide-transferase [Planctomycetota bacterium]
MILELLAWLNEAGFTVPGVSALSARAGLAAILAFWVALISGPPVVRWLTSKKVMEDEVNTDSKELNRINAAKAKVPTMGGVIIVGAVLISAIVCADLQNKYVKFALLSTLGYGLIGLADDWIKLTHRGRSGLAVKMKYVLQLAIAMAVAVAVTKMFQVIGQQLPERFPADYDPDLFEDLLALHVPFTDWRIDLSGWGGLPHMFLVLLVVTGTSNAVNLTDGMDGLAAGSVAVAALALAAVCVVVGRAHEFAPDRIFYSPHSQELAVFCSAMTGACLGFLWFNAPPAMVYMGDTGSLPLGSLLGYVAVVCKQELVLVIIGGVFVVETLSVIFQVGGYKLTGGKRLFLCAPLHHHYQFKKIPETRIVVRFWIVSIICAAIGLASLAVI